MKKFKCHILGIVLVLTLLLGACKQETPIPTPVVVSDHTPLAVSVSETDETTPDQTTAEPVEDRDLFLLSRFKPKLYCGHLATRTQISRKTLPGNCKTMPSKTRLALNSGKP